jgi:hypothetical protein
MKFKLSLPFVLLAALILSGSHQSRSLAQTGGIPGSAPVGSVPSPKGYPPSEVYPGISVPALSRDRHRQMMPGAF